MPGGFRYDSLDGGASDLTGFGLNYVVFGAGQSKLAQFDLLTGTGAQVIAGVGFEPELLFIFGADASLNTLREAARWHFGVATGPAEQWALGAWAADNVAAEDRDGAFFSDRIISFLGASGPQVALDSFDADGFTLDRLASSGRTIPMAYLAIRGGGPYKAGVATTPTSVGIQDVNTVGFEPDLVFIGSTRKQIDESSGHASISLGAGDSERQFATWAGANEASNNSTSRQDADSIAILAVTTGGSHSVRAHAVLDALDADGFDLEWIVVDTVGYKYGWLAVENAATDQFIFDKTANDLFVVTPLPPKALLGYNTSILPADEEIFKAGCAIAVSGCDQALLERSASFAVYDAPAFGVQQSSSYFSSGCFGCQERRSGGGVGEVGAVSTLHDCDLVRFQGDWIPQIYRRVIQV